MTNLSIAERLFEDHELLVDNLMNWNSNSKNRVLFLQCNDKVALFNMPENFLGGKQMAAGSEHDEHTRLVTAAFHYYAELIESILIL